MKDFLVNATIRTDRFFNTGVLKIGKDSIEGLFTWDYVKIFLDGERLSLIIKEYIFEYNSSFHMFHSDIKQTIYDCKYKEEYLESPETYILFNEAGEELDLVLKNPIKDPERISQILNSIEEFKK